MFVKIRHVLSYVLLMAALCMASHEAMAQVVVIMAKGATDTMSKEQVLDAFMGKIAGMVPVDQAEGNPIRDEFYTKVLGKSASQMKSYWSKRMFTGKGTPPKEYANSTEVNRAVSSNPNAIGYIEKSAVGAGVKVVFE